MINVIKTALDGVLIIEPAVHGDHRGYFMETYSRADFEAAGITNDFVQDNESMTMKKGTIRGIHFQLDPMAQAKTVRVVSGTLRDIAVDLRKGSPTYKKWIAVELSADNKRMLYLPRGFGHGFETLSDNVVFCYKVDNPYSRENDRSVCWHDESIGVEWLTKEPILSDKDKNAPLLKDSDCNFIFRG